MKDLFQGLFDKEDFSQFTKQELVEVKCKTCGSAVNINANYAKHIDTVDSCTSCRR